MRFVCLPSVCEQALDPASRRLERKTWLGNAPECTATNSFTWENYYYMTGLDTPG